VVERVRKRLLLEAAVNVPPCPAHVRAPDGRQKSLGLEVQTFEPQGFSLF
jgi:hypothetical protein